MKQNIYDVPGFFKGYKRMRENLTSLNDTIEQTAILSLLPEVKDYDVLDLGCGAGELARRIKQLGAKTVLGVDISTNMLDLAKKDIPEGVTFRQQAMEDLKLEPEQLDLVVSSLSFHYVVDIQELFHNIHKWLKPGGVLLFSTEHPIMTSSQGIHHGWAKDAAGNKLFWPVDCYNQEGKRVSHWFVAGVIKYHRTISTIINTLTNSGFRIQTVLEPVASEENEKRVPALKEARRRPPYLIMKADRCILHDLSA